MGTYYEREVGIGESWTLTCVELTFHVPLIYLKKMSLTESGS